MCLYPKLIKNRRYTETKKNGGVIPAVSDARTLYVPVGCGQCMECRREKSREWQVRLQEEIKTQRNGKFVTLTFNTESIIKLTKRVRDKADDPFQINGYIMDNAMATTAVRLFLERWRKEHKKSVRHWLVTELGHGQTEHIHLHGIIWTDKIEDITKHWQYGYTWTGYKKNEQIENYVTERTVNYIIKYVSKIDEQHKYYKSIILCSPGIGGNYTNRMDSKSNKYKENETNETYKTNTGHKVALPIYYRNKLYTEEEKEKLWIEKLDKNERWVNGEKIDISKGLTEYFKLVEWHRKRNKELGYGNNEKDWKREEYEHQIRILKQSTRIAPQG